MRRSEVFSKLRSIAIPLIKLYYDFRWAIQEHPIWLLLVILSPIIGIVAGKISIGWAPLGAEYPAARSLFTALISAQASILAIVFSVGLVILQLLAQRYSQGLLRQLVRFPLFNLVFLLFILSISINIWLLYNLPSDVNTIGAILSVGATTLSLVTISSIVLLVKDGINLSESSQAVTSYLNTLQREQHLQRGTKLLDHSLEPVYEQLRTEIIDGRLISAERISESYYKYVRTYYRDYENYGYLSREDDKQVQEFSEKVFEDHLPGTAQIALGHGEYELGEDVLRYHYQLTTYGFQIEKRELISVGFRGLQSFVLREDISRTNPIYRTAVLYISLIIGGAYNSPNEELPEGLMEEYTTVINYFAYSDIISRSEPSPVQEILSVQLLLLRSQVNNGDPSWDQFWQLERRVISTIFTNEGVDSDVKPLLQEHFEEIYIMATTGAEYENTYKILIDILQVGIRDSILKSTGNGKKSNLIDYEEFHNIEDKFFQNGWHRVIADLMEEVGKHQLLEQFDKLTRDFEVDVDIEYGAGEYTQHLVSGPEIDDQNAFSELGFDIDRLFVLVPTFEHISERAHNVYVARRISNTDVQESIMYGGFNDQIDSFEDIKDSQGIFDFRIFSSDGDEIVVKFEPKPTPGDVDVLSKVRDAKFEDAFVSIFSLERAEDLELDRFENLSVITINKDIVL